MAWAFNSLAAPVTNTATLITFNMIDANGNAVTAPGAMQVRITGTGLSYSNTTGVLSGTVTSVQLYNNTTSTALETVTLNSAHQTTVAAEVTAFLSHALSFQSQLTTWGLSYGTAATNYNHMGTATSLTDGSVVKIALLNNSNAVVGYLKVTGNSIYADKPEAVGTVQYVELLDASGNSFSTPKIADYTGAAYSAAGTEMMFDEIAYGAKTNWETLFGVFAQGADTVTVAAANTFDIDAGVGNDTITGSAGIDTLNYRYATGGVEVDLSLGTAKFTDIATLTDYTHTISGVENVTGSLFGDSLTGNSGANVLFGGYDSQVDHLIGGLGNDTYVVIDTKDTILERVGEGTDTVNAYVNFSIASLNYVENLTLLGNATIATGNAAANVLTGNSLANYLNGQGGADTMAGGAGNDTYYVDNAGDTIVETAGNGTDTVVAFTNYALSATADVEVLKTNSDTGAVAINLTGSNTVNTITGNAGANVLDGGSAGGDGVTDTLNGLLGNDTYVLGAGSDNVVDTGGVDTITSSITRSLASYAATAASAIENLTLTGTAAINATGNAYNNVLIGNSGANVLTGGAGNDTLVGGAGNDTFVWEANGKDIVTDFGSSYFTVALNAAGVAGTPASTSTATGSGSLVMNLAKTRVYADVTTTGLNWNTSALTDPTVKGYQFYQGAAGANGTATHDVLADGTKKAINATTQRVTDEWSTANGLTTALATSIASGGHYLQVQTQASNTAGSAGAIRGQITAVAGSSDIISVAGLNISDFATISELAVTNGANTVISRYYNGVQHSLTLQNVTESALLSSHFAFASVSTDDTVTGTALNDDLFGGLGNDTISGGVGADRLFGEAGNDTLDGGTGADRMFGGLGNDTFKVDSMSDYVNDTGGTDTILSSLNYSLNTTALAAIENLGTTNAAGTGNLVLTGNALDNVITGNAGNNLIDGKAGADTLVGGAGNDTYIIDNAGDQITETSGTDTVKAYSSYTLGAGDSIEVLTSALSTGNIDLTGNSLDQKVIGNYGINNINGGAGNDTLTGGGGNDYFVFNSVLNATTNKDVITDFNPTYDTIKLENTGAGLFTTLGVGTLAASRFYVGTAAHDADDRIIYNKTTGTLSYDADGNGAGAAVAFAVLTNKPTLTNADFLVI